MSTTVLRHCDRCKKEIAEEHRGQIWIVQVLIVNESDYTQRNSSALRMYEKTNPLRQEWCRACVDKLNLIGRVYVAPKDSPMEPMPTFEDQLREIIRDEMESGRQA